MDHDDISRAITDIEHELRRDDRVFVQQFQGLWRTEITLVVAVVALLAAGAVLLTVGLATRSWPTWVGGAGAFFACAGLDDYRQRRHTRPAATIKPPRCAPHTTPTTGHHRAHKQTPAAASSTIGDWCARRVRRHHKPHGSP